jgi:hypothetical protein
MRGRATAAPPVYTEDQQVEMSFDLAGNLRMVGGAGPGGGLTDAELRAAPVDVLGPLTQLELANTPLFVTQIKDWSRTERVFMLDAWTAAPVADALQSVVQWYGNVAVGATTQPAVVPALKRLRLTHWRLATKSLATVGSVVVRIRANIAGLVVIGSPIAYSFDAGSRAGATTVAMTGGLDTAHGHFPEGFDFPSGTGLGFSLAGYGPTGTLTLQGVTRFAVHGYEYDPAA